MFTFLFQSYHGEISLCLHYFLSSSLLCQINIPAALFSEVAWQCCYKEFKAFLIGKNPFFLIFVTILHYGAVHKLCNLKIGDCWFLLCICSPVSFPCSLKKTCHHRKLRQTKCLTPIWPHLHKRGAIVRAVYHVRELRFILTWFMHPIYKDP